MTTWQFLATYLVFQRIGNGKPPTSRYPELELFLANVRRDLINAENIRKARDNLSKKERAALKELKNSNVVFRLQDKGSLPICIN